MSCLSVSGVLSVSNALFAAMFATTYKFGYARIENFLSKNNLKRPIEYEQNSLI